MVVGLGAEQKRLARWLALGFSFGALALALVLWHQFNSASGDLQFEERHAWIPTLGVEYHVGVDGLGLLMVLLSAIVVPMAMLASWKIEERVPLYFALVLFLQAGLFGTFTALNFFHWFIFWELSLIPASSSSSSGAGRCATSAATQFFIYTMAGSVALLLAFLAIFLCTGKFDFIELADMGRNGTLTSALSDELGWKQLNSEAVGADHLRRRVPRLRGEGAADPVPHLAACGLRRSADGHDHAADRRDVQDGRVWLPAHPAADLPGANALAV